jgi:hypothetical protein
MKLMRWELIPRTRSTPQLDLAIIPGRVHMAAPRYPADALAVPLRSIPGHPDTSSARWLMGRVKAVVTCNPVRMWIVSRRRQMGNEALNIAIRIWRTDLNASCMMSRNIARL